MPAIDSLMKRMGFVRLSQYGLVLTPEGRIISLRPTVLDDGGGTPVVGWKDDDLAEVELAKWPPAPATQRAVANQVAISMPPPGPVSAPIFAVPPPSPAVQVVTIPVAPPAPVVASQPLEEDDWEWEIAIARARVAAEDTQLVVRTAAPAPSVAPRRRGDTVPPPLTIPMVATKVEPDARSAALGNAMESWPKTEPLGTIDYEDYTSTTNQIMRTSVVHVPPPVPTTVIPVPAMTKVTDPAQLAPVRRTAPSVPVTPIPPASPRRFANGTGSHQPKEAAPAKPMQAPAAATLPRLPKLPTTRVS